MLYKGFPLLLLLLGVSLTLIEACHRNYPRNAQPFCMSINCKDRVYVHGYYWVFYSYIRDCHGNIRCCTTVKYCKHCDYCRNCYQDNVMPIEKRRRSPIRSAALYAPVDDLEPSLQGKLYNTEHEYEQQWISFHIYYIFFQHMPGQASKEQRRVDFSGAAPKPLKAANNLPYPINVDRDIARDASLTQFVSIKLYPDSRFMPMLCCDVYQMQLPDTKAVLLYKGNAVTMHSYTYSWCPRIHTFGPIDHRISVFLTTHKYWRSIYIGTVNDAPYNDLVNCEDMRDKLNPISALYLVCYEFHMMDNLFLFQKKISIHHIKCYLGAYEKFPKLISTKYVVKYGNRCNCPCD